MENWQRYRFAARLSSCLVVHCIARQCSVLALHCCLAFSIARIRSLRNRARRLFSAPGHFLACACSLKAMQSAVACAPATAAAARTLWLPLLQSSSAASCRRSSSICVTSSIRQKHHQGHRGALHSSARASTSNATIHARPHSACQPSSMCLPSATPILHHQTTQRWHQYRRSYATAAAGSTASATTLSPEHISIPPVRAGSAQQHEIRAFKRQRRRYRALYILLGVGVAGALGYHFIPPVRRGVIATKRITLVASAVLACIADYKILFWREWDDPAIRHRDYKRCHSKLESEVARRAGLTVGHRTTERCAERILAVLKKNGGIYIKLGQHLSSVQLIPEEWTTTMRPLQDQCFPTPLDEIEALFLHDIGEPIQDLFEDFSVDPIGVASLAQVHTAIDKTTGKKVAVKVMHPDLQEFTKLDMVTV